MNNEKVTQFMSLGGQAIASQIDLGTDAQRKLGAQLLLSEVLEYVIKGLGVTPEVNGVKITEPENLQYHVAQQADVTEMVDGLADVAYTMYWNSNAFGIPLEEAYEMVCDNNLEKFVKLGAWAAGLTELPPEQWGCRTEVTWPSEVVKVQVVTYKGELWAVGKDARGKVRKPGSYKPVDLSQIINHAGVA